MNEVTAWLWNGDGFTACDSVPIADRGFRYGMSVFESFPVVNRRPLFLAEHLARLSQACKIAGFQTSLPGVIGLAKLLHEIPFDAFVRIYVTAGEGSADASGRGSVFIFAEPHDFKKIPTAYSLVSDHGPYVPPHPGLKTANYWANILALQEARKRRCDEALLFNLRGELVSASMANVFIVRAGKIETPSPECGAREGVVREWVLRRRDVAQPRINGAALSGAEEIFLTNSRLGVMPVAALDARPLRSRAVAEQLRVEYLREIGEVAGGG